MPASSTEQTDDIESVLRPRTRLLRSVDVSGCVPETAELVQTNPPLLTLEDFKDRTAHSIGLAGEQDTDLLSLFRSVIVNETNSVDAGVVQVSAGDRANGEPPIHFNVLLDEFLPEDNATKRQASDTIEQVVGQCGQQYLQSFLDTAHPICGVLAKDRFLSAFEHNKLAIPASLRGAVYALGRMFQQKTAEVDGKLDAEVRGLFEEAHRSLHPEHHAPNLWNLQAALLLVHELPADNYTMETPRTWILSSQAVASAQLIGLHRDPAHWNIAQWEKRLRKKLWWATYMCDVWSSICHGSPPHIHESSFNTEMPMLDDVLQDEDSTNLLESTSRSCSIATAARFVESVKLSRILHRLLDTALYAIPITFSIAALQANTF